MGEPSYDWEFEKRLLIAIIVMPISTIGVLSIDFSPGVAIFFLIIGTLGVFRLGYRGAVLLWVFLIMYCAYFGLVGGFYGTALLFFITGVVVIFGMLLSEAARKERERVERLRREKERKERVEFEKKQKEKGLVNFVRGDGKEKWGTPEQVKQWKELDIGLSNNFAEYTPREFEKFVCDLFRKMGYDVGLTPASGDYGVDVVAKKPGNTVAIQVKKYAEGNMVGAPVVQQTLGAMWKVKADQSIIVTTSGFTVYAQEQAKEAPIELWDKRTLHEIVRKYMV